MEESYVVIARRYRPQRFSEVVGQEAIVRTLRKAICSKKTAHAYIFAGERGTGKTSLARLCAKALNCSSLSPDGEPCNRCTSCLEISESRSLDVQEIDGASNRGIDHIRSLTQSTCYSSVSPYKIYIIDEVHMLTKEAFNALLKTLEEPPARVTFFLATTEVHKIPSTIQSRCQRFYLKRLSKEAIVSKLKKIITEMRVEATEEALNRLAAYADGGLRDAESLLDQIIAFSDGVIDASSLEEVLGLLPHTFFISLHQAIQAHDIESAYTLSDMIFYQGKDLHHCLEDLFAHFKDIILYKLKSPHSSITSSPEDETFRNSCLLLSSEHILEILRLITDAQKNLFSSSSNRFILEMLLIHIVTILQKIPLPLLAKKMIDLEKMIQQVPIPSQKPPEAASSPTIHAEPHQIQIQSSPIPTLSEAHEEVRQENLIHFAATQLNATIQKKN